MTRYCALVMVVAAFGASAANAAPSVTNGGFTSSTFTSSQEFGEAWGGQGVDGWTLSNSPAWTSLGLGFWFQPADVAAGVDAANYGGDNYAMLPTSVVASPAGGDIIALDGDFGYRGFLYQAINGLTAGSDYNVSFYWGGTQLLDRYGPTTESVTVGLGATLGGGATQTTGTVSTAPQGFSGWIAETETFHAVASSEYLSFLANGTPLGLPPVVVLSGVSLTAVPEPASLAVLGFALTACLAGRAWAGGRARLRVRA